MPRRRTRAPLAVAELESRLAPSNTPPVLVRDINPGSGGSNPQETVLVNGTLFFSAVDQPGITGYELWASDGTSTGTRLVRDINTFGSGSGSYPSELTEVNGKLFFTATGAEGNELWTSDGTSAGTVLVSDINAMFGSYPRGLTNVNGTLFFTANDGGNGYELWASDGTATGTRLVRDIGAGQFSGAGSVPGVNVGGVFFFPAQEFAPCGIGFGYELWKSDGTSAGTVLVRDINATSYYGGSDPKYLTAFQGALFFSANDGTQGNQVWTSDGTSAGTQLLNLINPSGPSDPAQFTAVGNSLYFSATDGVNGPELWKTDGTSAGTAIVQDINPGSAGSDPRSLANVGGMLFFSANDGTSGRELWKSDGTSGGTLLVADITSSPYNSEINYITDVDGIAYFALGTADLPSELYRSDGTSAGTTLIDLDPNSASDPFGLVADGQRLYFSGFRPDVGRELFSLLEDNTPPTISVIDSADIDGSYYTGETVSIRLTFSEPVVLDDNSGAGALLITLDTGVTIGIGNFTGSDIEVFYNIGPGEQSSDLNVISISLVNGATLRDAVGNDAILTLPLQNLAVTSDLMINLPNTNPTITDIPDQNVNAGTLINAVPFFVNDTESGSGPLTLSVVSDNPGLIPVSAVTFTGTGGPRFISIATPAGQSGIAVLTVTVTDPNGGSASDNVTVFVNGPPTISDIPDQMVVAGSTVGPLAFTIGGNLTPPGNLQLSVVSDNVAIPASAVTFGGSGANRTITVNTTAGISATSTLTVTVTDPNSSFTASDNFTIIQTVLQPPTISDIPDQQAIAGTTVGPIPFNVGNMSGMPDLLVLSVVSDNVAIPASAVTFGGSGANRTITVNTAAGIATTTTLTVTVTDPSSNLTASDNVTIVQTVPNTPPTISDVGNQVVTAGGTVGPLAFTIGDLETPLNSLLVSASSTNASLGLIALGGSGANRTVTIATPPGQTGTATITLTVQDAGGLVVSDTFDIIVTGTPNTSVTKDYTIGRGADEEVSLLRFFNPDGTEKLSIAPFGTEYTCGIRTATADFNNDGIADYAVGMGGHKWPSRVIVFDGESQNVLLDFLPFGDDFRRGVLLSAGDITGDGRAELSITADQGGGARVRVFSPVGISGLDLRPGGSITLAGPPVTFVQMADFFALQDANGVADTAFRGGAHTAIGDLNGDGFGDLFFAAGTGGGPRVAVFDGSKLGQNGAPKLRGDFMAFEANLRNGSFLAVGDIDADGIADLVASPGLGGGPRVSVFSGAALLANQEVRIADFFVGDPAGRGGLRVAVKNLDNDANMDILVGAGPGDSNRATGYSGANLVGIGPITPIFDYEVFASDYPIGVWVG